jgi:hypothetical protein
MPTGGRNRDRDNLTLRHKRTKGGESVFCPSFIHAFAA